MKQAKALKKGDTIGIAAPASPFDRSKFLKGIAAIEKLGFKTFYRRDIFDQSRYLAGSDKRRAEEFMELMSSREIAAIMFARGGYGSQRIIPLLNASKISELKKPVLGFSDITALLAFLRQSAGLPTFYGPVVTQMGQAKSERTGASLLYALTKKGEYGDIPMGGTRILRTGKAKGKITGGCLSLINSSMGTPYELNFENAILFIEEINEKVYVLDRMLTQLKNAGAFEKISGMIFGSLLPPEEDSQNVDAMIRDVLGNFKKPVVMDFPAGHIDDFITLPMGIEAELIAEEGKTPVLNCTEGLLF